MKWKPSQEMTLYHETIVSCLWGYFELCYWAVFIVFSFILISFEQVVLQPLFCNQFEECRGPQFQLVIVVTSWICMAHRSNKLRSWGKSPNKQRMSWSDPLPPKWFEKAEKLAIFTNKSQFLYKKPLARGFGLRMVIIATDTTLENSIQWSAQCIMCFKLIFH